MLVLGLLQADVDHAFYPARLRPGRRSSGRPRQRRRGTAATTAGLYRGCVLAAADGAAAGCRPHLADRHRGPDRAAGADRRGRSTAGWRHATDGRSPAGQHEAARRGPAGPAIDPAQPCACRPRRPGRRAQASHRRACGGQCRNGGAAGARRQQRPALWRRHHLSAGQRRPHHHGWRSGHGGRHRIHRALHAGAHPGQHRLDLDRHPRWEAGAHRLRRQPECTGLPAEGQSPLSALDRGLQAQLRNGTGAALRSAAHPASGRQQLELCRRQQGQRRGTDLQRLRGCGREEVRRAVGQGTAGTR